MLFRRLFLESLEKAFKSGELRFFSSLQPLREPRAFRRYLDPARRANWVVFAKPPFAGPQQVLEYVGCYTHRVAISNNRLLDIEDGKVRFRWKDYRAGNQHKTMTLTVDEFIRRFLTHVPPEGFQRIRYYGLFGNRYRKEKLPDAVNSWTWPSPSRPRRERRAKPRQTIAIRSNTSPAYLSGNAPFVTTAAWYASRF